MVDSPARGLAVAFPTVCVFLTVVLALGVQAAPLTVLQSNPRYFTDGSGKAVYLTGIDLGGWDTQDNMWGIRASLDWNGFLNVMQSHNLNHIRLWNVEHTTADGTSYWLPGPYDHSILANPMPWNRTGPGTANDGLLKYNLSQFDQAYFNHLRSLVSTAGSRGIYVSVKLFEGFSTSKKRYSNQAADPWPYHPFHPANNINSINGDLNGDGDGRDVHTLGNSAVVNFQRAYVRKMVDTVSDLDNVLYEISNEDHTDTLNWQYDMISYIKSYEASKPKQHPVGMSAISDYTQTGLWFNDYLWNSPADYISPGGGSAGDHDYLNDIPLADGRKVVLTGFDYLDYS